MTIKANNSMLRQKQKKKRLLSKSYTQLYSKNINNHSEYFDFSSNATDLVFKPASIVGGFKVPSKTMYPFMTSILEVDLFSNSVIFSCAGTLIAPDVVLTAGHCVENSAVRLVEIGRFALNSELEEEEEYETIRVSQVYLHPNFNQDFFLNDVALLKLATKSNKATSMFIKLKEGSFQLQEKDDVTIVGWGLQSHQGTSEPELHQTDVSIITDEECSKTYGNFISNTMICAYGEGKDACQGDSGGPALMKDNDKNELYQVGIVSWGEDCGKNPGVYTDLQSPVIMDFINYHMCNNKSGLAIESCSLDGLFYGQLTTTSLNSTQYDRCTNDPSYNCERLSNFPFVGCLLNAKDCPEICCPDSCVPGIGCV